ncbi:MAG: ABC transporter permease [Methanomassiliicoccales archaeon]|nr:MAG: ABC transporter permease [Methanomassiliicoccales archaeon]
MLIQKKNIIGMILCIMLFSASVPILMGVKSSPDSMFQGEDILTLTQANTNTPISASLAQKLNEQDFVVVASPEIHAFSYTINRRNKDYEPVIVRGVEPAIFLQIESARLLKGGYDGNFMLVGEGLSRRLGVQVGHNVTITGSTVPAILESTTTGIFSSSTSANDHILIPLDSARKFMGLSKDDVISIRVKTDNEQMLIDFLTDQEYSVVVSTKSGIPISVNENKTYEEKLAEELAIKWTDTAEFSASNQSFISTFIQRGAGTIGVVVLGFITLNALLTFIGITAILARAVIERRKDIGILAAIGADKKAIYLLLLKDLLIISIIASGIGVLLGFISAVIIQDLGIIVAFGIIIQPAIDLTLLIITFLVAILIGCTSGLMVSSIILATRPSKLMQDVEDVEEAFETETLSESIGV